MIKNAAVRMLWITFTEGGRTISSTIVIVQFAPKQLFIMPSAIDNITNLGVWIQLTEGVRIILLTGVKILPVGSIPRKVVLRVNINAVRYAPVEPDDHPQVRDVVHEG